MIVSWILRQDKYRTHSALNLYQRPVIRRITQAARTHQTTGEKKKIARQMKKQDYKNRTLATNWVSKAPNWKQVDARTPPKLSPSTRYYWCHGALCNLPRYGEHYLTYDKLKWDNDFGLSAAKAWPLNDEIIYKAKKWMEWRGIYAAGCSNFQIVVYLFYISKLAVIYVLQLPWCLFSRTAFFIQRMKESSLIPYTLISMPGLGWALDVEKGVKPL